jgi:hypothetical protein
VRCLTAPDILAEWSLSTSSTSHVAVEAVANSTESTSSKVSVEKKSIK